MMECKYLHCDEETYVDYCHEHETLGMFMGEGIVHKIFCINCLRLRVSPMHWLCCKF